VRWSTSWAAVKDVLLTGTGMVLILSQVFSKMPSDVILVTGLALTVPSVAGHAASLLQGPSAPRSSPPQQLPGRLPSEPLPPEVTGND
jgi:hypothetical protein